MYNADPALKHDIKQLYGEIQDLAEKHDTLFEYIVRDLYDYHFREG